MQPDNLKANLTELNDDLSILLNLLENNLEEKDTYIDICMKKTKQMIKKLGDFNE